MRLLIEMDIYTSLPSIPLISNFISKKNVYKLYILYRMIKEYTGWTLINNNTINIKNTHTSNNIQILSKQDMNLFLENIAFIVHNQVSTPINNSKGLDDIRNFKKCADVFDTIEDVTTMISELDYEQQIIYTEFEGNKLLGFALIRPKKMESVLYIQLICSIQKGIGSKIMSEIEQFAKHNRYKGIELHPTSKSIEFYKKQGFSSKIKNKFSGKIMFKDLY